MPYTAPRASWQETTSVLGTRHSQAYLPCLCPAWTACVEVGQITYLLLLFLEAWIWMHKLRRSIRISIRGFVDGFPVQDLARRPKRYKRRARNNSIERGTVRFVRRNRPRKRSVSFECPIERIYDPVCIIVSRLNVSINLVRTNVSDR